MALGVSEHGIFIVGCPRSGTTLLQSLLATQPGVVSFPETHFFEIFDSNEKHAGPDGWRQAIRSFETKSGTCFLTDLIPRISDQPCDAEDDWRKPVFENLIHLIIEGTRPETSVKNLRWIEKTPFHVFHLLTIHSLFPKSKIVNITRDPRNAIFSMKSKLPGMKSASVADLAALWRDSIRAYEKFSSSTPHHGISVRYEDLASNPADSVSTICDYLEIEFERARLGRRQAIARGISHSSETWKSDVSGSKIKAPAQGNFKTRQLKAILQIQSIAGAEMARHGYELKFRPAQSAYQRYLSIRKQSVAP